MMKRDDCLEVLARHRTDEIVVAVYKAAQEWIHLAPSDLNYTFSGAMGQGSSHALGLALGRPDRRILVLDGDGSLLMNLGSLVSVVEAAPRNFVHFVCENGTYEANGAHPIPGRNRVSFVGFARSAGYARCHEFTDLAEFETRIPAVLREEGPVFVDLKVEPGKPSPQDSGYIHSAAARSAFKAALRSS